MTGRAVARLLLVAAIALGVAGLIWWSRDEATTSSARGPLAREKKNQAPENVVVSGGATRPVGAAGPGMPAALQGESRVADELNAAGGTLQRDLQILNEVFEMWVSNFPRDGNPVGLNSEITAALAGANAHQFAFIPPRHRAINAAGELCDRWGTPFRFHQLSGRHMEIRSAGPDRKFGTEDDAAWTPPP